jgi:hypothetical protein
MRARAVQRSTRAAEEALEAGPIDVQASQVHGTGHTAASITAEASLDLGQS